MLDVGFSKGVGKREGGKMCGTIYVRERERTISYGDGEKGGIKLERFVGKAMGTGVGT